MGVPLSDLLITCERVSDHCSNIAVCIIQISKSNLDNHDYLNELKAERSPEFMRQYKLFKERYRLSV
jgi:phosphate:Na+ symporter